MVMGACLMSLLPVPGVEHLPGFDRSLVHCYINMMRVGSLSLPDFKENNFDISSLTAVFSVHFYS